MILTQAQESKAESTAAFKENLSDQGNKTSIAVTGRSPTKPKKALADGAVLNQPLANGHPAVQLLAQNSDGAALLKQMMQRKPFESRTQVEYYGLPPGIKVSCDASVLCSVFMFITCALLLCHGRSCCKDAPV